MYINFSWRFCQSKLMERDVLLENLAINGKYIKEDA